jgi:glycosyltransferase involved in cell wall biosynthesis
VNAGFFPSAINPTGVNFTASRAMHAPVFGQSRTLLSVKVYIAHFIIYLFRRLNHQSEKLAGRFLRHCNLYELSRFFPEVARRFHARRASRILPLNVLHLISSSGFYGAERVSLELSKGLLAMGGRPVIAILVSNPEISRDMVREAGSSGIETRVLHCDAMFSLRVMRDLRGLIREKGIDLVHSHGYKSNFYALWATGRKLPLVATNHNWLKHHWRLVAYSLIDKRLIRLFDRIVAVSELIRNEMVEAGVPGGKITVIDNGVDVEEIEKQVRSALPGEMFPEDDATKIVGAIGSLKEEKGFRFLIEAAGNVVPTEGKVKFLIVGDGPLRGELERLAASRGAEGNIVFTGYRNDVYKLLGTFDIFVLPSVKEGLPMVLLEAMAAGIPVVATRVGAVPRVLIDGVNGLLVSPGDAGALRKAIETLLTNPSIAESIAASGYETVRAKFSSVSMFSKYHATYLDALEGRK